MQIDFHHATTYAMARLAGFPHGEAATIATAAQCVDDATSQDLIHFDNHAPYAPFASAHALPRPFDGTKDPWENRKQASNADAWLPFHFLPGNGGLGALDAPVLDPVRRLVCQPDSQVAGRMTEACLATRGRPGDLHRLGITAHVYADAFAHAGFAGIVDPVNEVRELRHQDASWLHRLLEDVESLSARTIPLGHGMALDLPDLPFLTWGYVDRDGHAWDRDNPKIFLHAARRLLDLFLAWRGAEGTRALADGDRDLLAWAFSTFTDEHGAARHDAWMDLLAGFLDGRAFSFGSLDPLELETLRYVPKGPGSWKERALGPASREDREDASFTWTAAFEESDWKRFHDALKDHLSEVRDRILPGFGLCLAFRPLLRA